MCEHVVSLGASTNGWRAGGGGPALPWDVAQHVPELGGHTNVQSAEPWH